MFSIYSTNTVLVVANILVQTRDAAARVKHIIDEKNVMTWANHFNICLALICFATSNKKLLLKLMFFYLRYCPNVFKHGPNARISVVRVYTLKLYNVGKGE